MFKPGKRDLWLEGEKERQSLADKAGVKRIGTWITTVGNISEATVLSAYENYEQWQKVGAALGKNAKYQTIIRKNQENLVSVTDKIMTPTPGSPLQ